MRLPPKAARPTTEETRARILGKADELFRQYGCGKTTVSDIAQELGMSSANIYKFFSSKDAIVQASADLNLSLLRQSILTVVQARQPAIKRLENVALAVFRFHQDLWRNEHLIFKMVIQAHQEAWKSIEDYNAFLFQTIKGVLEQGMIKGEIRSHESSALTTALLDALYVALHPYLRQAWSPNETEDRVRAHIKFALAALK